MSFFIPIILSSSKNQLSFPLSMLSPTTFSFITHLQFITFIQPLIKNDKMSLPHALPYPNLAWSYSHIAQIFRALKVAMDGDMTSTIHLGHCNPLYLGISWKRRLLYKSLYHLLMLSIFVIKTEDTNTKFEWYFKYLYKA